MVYEDSKKININIFFYLFIVLISFLFLKDVLSFIEYYFHITMLNKNILSFLLLFLLAWNTIRHFKFTRITFNIYDIICILVILFLTILRLPFPDFSWDTLNYHLLFQKSSFLNFLEYNYFPSGMESFYFPLADRPFYFTRKLFGYRMGTVFNTFILVLLYYQLKDFLMLYIKERNYTIRIYWICFSSLFILSTEFILLNLSTYLTDLVYLPILLEMFRIVFFKAEYTKGNSYYIAYLTGLTIALKLTSSVFALLLIVFYIIQNLRLIKLKTYFVSFIIAILPVSIYLFYNFINTGNPVFPLYNTLFKSQYWPSNNLNFADFGPHGFVETLTWPFNSMFVPERLSQLKIISGRLFISFVAAGIFLILLLVFKKYKNKLIQRIITINLLLLFIWSATSGYIRYGIFCEILGGILIFALVVEGLHSNKTLLKLMGSMLVFSVIIQVYISYDYYLFKNYDWAVRQPALKRHDLYKQNVVMLGQDKGPDYQIDINIKNKIQAWIITDHNSGLPYLINMDVPMINPLAAPFTNSTKLMYDKYWSKDDFRNKKFYTFSFNPDETQKYLLNNNFKIISVQEIKPTFLNKEQTGYLIEITPN